MEPERLLEEIEELRAEVDRLNAERPATATPLGVHPDTVVASERFSTYEYTPTHTAWRILGTFRDDEPMPLRQIYSILRREDAENGHLVYVRENEVQRELEKLWRMECISIAILEGRAMLTARGRTLLHSRGRSVTFRVSVDRFYGRMDEIRVYNHPIGIDTDSTFLNRPNPTGNILERDIQGLYPNIDFQHWQRDVRTYNTQHGRVHMPTRTRGQSMRFVYEGEPLEGVVSSVVERSEPGTVLTVREYEVYANTQRYPHTMFVITQSMNPVTGAPAHSRVTIRR